MEKRPSSAKAAKQHFNLRGMGPSQMTVGHEIQRLVAYYSGLQVPTWSRLMRWFSTSPRPNCHHLSFPAQSLMLTRSRRSCLSPQTLQLTSRGHLSLNCQNLTLLRSCWCPQMLQLMSRGQQLSRKCLPGHLWTPPRTYVHDPAYQQWHTALQVRRCSQPPPRKRRMLGSGTGCVAESRDHLGHLPLPSPH